ncbi:MAG: hypothetical protein U0235_13325 [Polyangiaceae bacterium]
MNMSSKSKLFGIITATALALASTAALADVKHEGTWPEQDKNVSLDVSGVSRSEAVKKLADAAGWSVVAEGLAPSGASTVDLRVKDQPASRVLDLVLSGGDFVATRNGDLIQIKPASAAAAATAPVAPAATAPAAPAAPQPPPAPPAPPAKTEKKAHGRAEDRTVFGSNVRIDADETVKDLTVFGGNVELAGHVTHDLTVFGGNVHLLSGARVEGDATLLGGNLQLDEGSAIDEDVSLVGGNMERAPGAKIGGSVEQKAEKHIGINLGDELKKEGAHGFLATVGNRLTSMAILFVFGTILLALGAGRMEAMRVEVAARPMRTFALGVVGFFAAILTVVVLCVTVVGIPFALIGIFLAVLAGYAGATAALTTFGAAVLHHRTENPYVHLAFGCVALFVIGLIPFVGGAASVIVGALGIGVIVATRGAGYFAKKPREMGPYRTGEVA